MIKTQKILFILTLIYLTSCSDRGRTNKDTEIRTNQLIKKEGAYISKQCHIRLNIHVDSMLVKFSISDTLNNPLFISKTPQASDTQKWSFLIDSIGNVWLNSSDIGLYVVQKDSNDIYRLNPYSLNKQTIKLLTSKLVEDLPGSIKDNLR